MKREEQILKRLTEQEGGLFYDTALRAMREFAKKQPLPPAEGADCFYYDKPGKEKITPAQQQPPAEGATDRFRDVLNEVQRYIETNGGATESEMKTIWNSLSCAITESEKRQPTAEGAEAIQPHITCPKCGSTNNSELAKNDRLCYDCNHSWSEQQPTADKMVEEEYDIDFGGHLKAGIRVSASRIEIIGAVNGWGNAVPDDDIKVTKIEP